MNNSVRSIYENGKEALTKANIENCAFEAAEMCLSCFGIDKTAFLLSPDAEVCEEDIKRYERMISERISGRPLQYILGEWSFYGRSFSVGEGVLIPRPETEQLADICISEIKKHGYKTVFDLCSGTGCIGITVALACPEAEVYLFELYDGAMKFLRKNTEKYQNGNIRIVPCDILGDIPSELPQSDVIVSNPPYIPEKELDGLQTEVRHEPATALDGGESGLDFYRKIARDWVAKLNDGGFLAVECGEGQGGEISDMLEENGKTDIVSDLYGAERFVTLYKKGKYK